MSPLFSPVSAGGIGKATYTATTGSPTIDTSSRAGKTIIKYTGSGSITIGTAGYVEILMVGGGSGGFGTGGQLGGGAGGGAGGYFYSASLFLPIGTWIATVGAGGSYALSPGSSNNAAGNMSSISQTSLGLIITAVGANPYNPYSGYNTTAFGNLVGGSTAGFGSIANGTAQPATFGQGFAGGNNTSASNYAAAGGGGAGGVGGNAGAGNSGVGGAGGVGLSNSITGSAVFYAGGGGGVGGDNGSYGGGGAGGNGGGGAGAPSTSSAGTAGTVNTGGGAGGQVSSSATGANGGSGYVVIVLG